MHILYIFAIIGGAKKLGYVIPNDEGMSDFTTPHQPGTNYSYNPLPPSISPVWLYNSGRPSLSLAAAMTLQSPGHSLNEMKRNRGFAGFDYPRFLYVTSRLLACSWAEGRKCLLYHIFRGTNNRGQSKLIFKFTLTPVKI
jgi:hypothetical protein